MTLTLLDQTAALVGTDDALRFYEALADAMLFVLLDSAPDGDSISPRVITAEGQDMVLAFDTELRLSEFAGEVAYAEIPGRVLAGMLAEAGLGLALNPDVSDHAVVLPPEALSWLVETLGAVAPESVEGRIAELLPPSDVPQAVLTALDAKLARAEGLADAAFLVTTRDTNGAPGHLLAITGAAEAAEPALVRAVNEALAFSGLEAGSLDVGFFAADHPVMARLTRVGLRFDLAKPAPAAPGTDPAKPPKLR